MEKRFTIEPTEVAALRPDTLVSLEHTSWWDKLTADLKEKLNTPTRAFLLAIIMEIAMSTQVEAQTQSNQTKVPPNNQSAALSMEASIDSQEMYEAWLRFKSKNGWLFVNQNRTEGKTKTDFVYGGVGKEVVLNNKTKINTMVGPQFDLNQQAISHVAGFVNMNGEISGIKFNSINRFAIPLEERYAFVDRHVQNISGIPKTPSRMSVQAKERYIHGKADKWDELKIGTVIEFGIQGGKGKAYVYADAANKSLGIRLTINKRF